MYVFWQRNLLGPCTSVCVMTKGSWLLCGGDGYSELPGTRVCVMTTGFCVFWWTLVWWGCSYNGLQFFLPTDRRISLDWMQIILCPSPLSFTPVEGAQRAVSSEQRAASSCSAPRGLHHSLRWLLAHAAPLGIYHSGPVVQRVTGPTLSAPPRTDPGNPVSAPCS